MTAESPDTTETKRLAADLAALLGREQGDALLTRSRTLLTLSASRPGHQTSEFRVVLLAVLAGLALVGAAVFTGDERYADQGLELIQWATVGYAVSRGIAKAGAAKQTPTQ